MATVVTHLRVDIRALPVAHQIIFALPLPRDLWIVTLVQILSLLCDGYYRTFLLRFDVSFRRSLFA